MSAAIAAQFVKSDTSWQYTDDDHALTFTDKLIGLEVVIKTFDGETPDVCVVVPPVMVGSLAKSLIAFLTTGSIAIARQVDE